MRGLTQVIYYIIFDANFLILIIILTVWKNLVRVDVVRSQHFELVFYMTIPLNLMN